MKWDIGKNTRTVSHKEKNQIMLQGQSINKFIFIKQGFVRVYDISTKGDQKTILILGPGDFFPLVWSKEKGTKLHFYYEAYTDISASVIPSRKFYRYVDENGEFSKELLFYFAEKTHYLLERMAAVGSKKAKDKIVKVLEYLIQAHGTKVDSKTHVIPFTITHDDIAGMAGVTRETVTNTLNKIDRELLVSRGNKTYIYSQKLK